MTSDVPRPVVARALFNKITPSKMSGTPKKILLKRYSPMFLLRLQKPIGLSLKSLTGPASQWQNLTHIPSKWLSQRIFFSQRWQLWGWIADVPQLYVFHPVCFMWTNSDWDDKKKRYSHFLSNQNWNHLRYGVESCYPKIDCCYLF